MKKTMITFLALTLGSMFLLSCKSTGEVYEQGSHNSFYFSEEILSTLDSDRELVVCDRATLFNMLIGLNGYTVCSGVISEKLNGPNIVARPLDVDDYMEIGYILPGSMRPSPLTLRYIAILKELTER